MRRIFCMALLLLGAAILLSASFSINSSRAADSSKIAIAYHGCSCWDILNHAAELKPVYSSEGCIRKRPIWIKSEKAKPV